MGFDLDLKTDDAVKPAQDIVQEAPKAEGDGSWLLDSAGSLFIQKFRALVSASASVGQKMPREEYDLLRREFTALSTLECFAVQSSLSGTYAGFTAFMRDDYDNFGG